MISISESFEVVAARLSNKPKRAAVFTLVGEDGTRLRWTTEPTPAAEIALGAWAAKRRIFILGRAAELTDGTLLMADGAKIAYEGLPRGVEAIPGVYTD